MPRQASSITTTANPSYCAGGWNGCVPGIFAGEVVQRRGDLVAATRHREAGQKSFWTSIIIGTSDLRLGPSSTAPHSNSTIISTSTG